MSNIGYFVDRNPEIRAAGLTSAGDQHHADACFKFCHVEEAAEYVIHSKCDEYIKDNKKLLFKSTPFVPESTIGECLEAELLKSRFIQFKEKFSENMYFTKAQLGEVKPSGAKPDSVTNESQTFGRKSEQTDGVYQTIMPPKTPEQVNREYAKGHEKYIISHNHYFPAEQISRHYSKHFDRKSTFGHYMGVDDRGVMVKRCIANCHWPHIIGKSQLDFMRRTVGPLGSKYKRYSYDVPDITHGIRTAYDKCNVKMLLENASECYSYKALCDSFGYLTKLRSQLKRLVEFDFYDLLTSLESLDKDKTNLIKFEIIFQILNTMNIHIDSDKVRVIASYFQLFIDEGCASELVKYREVCKLLMLQEPLPKIELLSSVPPHAKHLSTVYRLFCADLKKKPVEDFTPRIKSLKQIDDDETHAEDLISPDLLTLKGLGLSEFTRLRSKEELCRIFHDIVSVEQFCDIWKKLLEQFKDQNGLFSVIQFRSLISEY